MAQVLDYLGGLKLSTDGYQDVVVDFENSPLNLVPAAMLEMPDHNFCPCECLVGDDNYGMEIQHHDGLFGIWSGPAGIAFANGLANQAHGFNNMQALIAPNLAPPIRTLMITKVKTDSLTRAVQMWGAAQEGVGRAVRDAWKRKWFRPTFARTHVLTVGVFIHPLAGLKAPGEGGKYDLKAFLEGQDLEKSMYGLYWLNYLATLGLLADALTGGLTPDERIERAEKARHPYRGYPVNKAAPEAIAT